MSFEIDDYLIPDIDRWIAKNRTQYADAFGLADRLSRVAQQVMLSAEVSTGDKRALLILLFFARALSSFQGALLLAERGVTVEAQTLARSCLESAFFLHNHRRRFCRQAHQLRRSAQEKGGDVVG
jgi:hypothetical protein